MAPAPCRDRPAAPAAAAVPGTHAARAARPARATAVLLLGAAAVLAVLLGAAPASAHAALTGSVPRQGAVADRAPEKVVLTFSARVTLSADSIRVLAPDGGRADTGEPRDLGTGGTVRHGVALRPGLPDGTYTVAWRAVSADGHPVSGAYTFSVGAPSSTAAALPDDRPGSGLTGLLHAVARYAAYAGFVLLVGSGAFVLGCRPSAASIAALRRLVIRGWAVVTAATFALLLLRGPYTGGSGLAGMFDPGALRDVVATPSGTALVSRLLLLAVAALCVTVLLSPDRWSAGSAEGAAGETEREHRNARFWLAAAGGAVVATGLAATWAAAGHASTGLQPWLAVPVDVVHLLAVALWLGGLAALLVTLHRGPAAERQVVRRFSRVALGSVLVLATTGLYQSWRQAGSWDALTTTSFGRLLLVKVGMVALLLFFARWSRQRAGRLPDGPAGTAGESPGEPAAAPLTDPVPVPEPPAEDRPAPARSGASSLTAPVDAERAAQLARQRAALAAARERRVRDADPERTRLRRSVLAEAGVAALVLAVTTALTSTEPARTEVRTAGAAAGTPSAASAASGQPVMLDIPFDTGGEKGAGTAGLHLFDPASTCGNSLHLWLEDPDGKPLDVAEVKLAFTLPAEDVGPLPVKLAKLATGHWSAARFQLPLTGTWRASLTVRTSDIDQITETRNVKIN
ncbi:copper resistance protein CopC [Streptomyces sp. MNU89]|uniref:copper resistance CopC/CopD family protein n=1 Tax=Streptomyces sp. MNU89 TaxID=2560025 RepID=UPI001E33F6A5|nr:copper resistance protein CopC [Streptomyces sp. MNU89]MCC9740418.1 copper resistance protein CopC [Streptomyces sp. MNU89]